MTDQNLTEIICILDRSGSMASSANDAIGGFNTFLQDQKKQPGHALMTLCQFDTEYELVHSGKDIQVMPELTSETFKPRGGTALLDAIGRTLNEVGIRLSNTPEDKRPSKVLVVILTDGEENASREFTHPRIREMVKHQTEKYGWQFIYLGANQDAFTVGSSLGMLRGMTFNYSAAHTDRAYASVSSMATSYRKSGHVVPVAPEADDPDKN